MASIALLVVAAIERGRLAQLAFDALVAAAGGGLGAGALLLQQDVALASWILGPPVMAGLAIAHVRALVAAGGPFRT